MLTAAVTDLRNPAYAITNNRSMAPAQHRCLGTPSGSKRPVGSRRTQAWRALAAWGIAVEFADWMCPLTPIENGLRERAGLTVYQGDFIEQYILPVL